MTSRTPARLIYLPRRPAYGLPESWRGDHPKEMAAVWHAFFKAGRNKYLSSLMGLHGPPTSSPSSTTCRRTQQGSEEVIAYEYDAFAKASDYRYRLDDLRIDLRIDLLGGVAVASFYLATRRMIVNDHSFEGRAVIPRSRRTMLLGKVEGSWRIIHEHLSSMPEPGAHTAEGRLCDSRWRWARRDPHLVGR